MDRLLASKVLAIAAVAATSTGAAAEPTWRDAFQSSPAAYDPPSEDFIKFLSERVKIPMETIRANIAVEPVSGTVRYRIRLATGGTQVRVRLSNEESKTALKIGSASIGLAGDGFIAKSGSLRPLTFGGSRTIAIPAGAPAVSEPVTLAVAPGTDLVISVWLAAPMVNVARGGAGLLAGAGDQSLREVLVEPRRMMGRPLVSGVQVLNDEPRHVIVAMGDSITDGNREQPEATHGWPEQLARRLAQRQSGGVYSVVNAGIGGNRLLDNGSGQAGLARLDRDVLRIEGVSHLILLEGTNDIGMSGNGPMGNHPEVSAGELIAGYRQAISRAHARGIKVYLGTITPAGNSSHSTPAKDAIHEAVNHWIRTSGEADGVIDFEAMIRDPGARSQIRASYDSGDHVHPNDAGYKAMGDGIDLNMFP